MHSFYGAKGVDENTTVDSLLAQPSSQCGSYFDTVDLSAYWIPTLYQNGAAQHTETGAYQRRRVYVPRRRDLGLGHTRRGEPREPVHQPGIRLQPSDLSEHPPG